MKGIQVDPEHIPTIRAVYTHDVAVKMGHLRPDEKTQVELALNAIDEEEKRSVRLYATGKITEVVWDGLWREWQDRRNQLRRSLSALQERQQTHIENLDMALQVISNVGIVYNELCQDDKRELLRHMVERVIVDSSGNAKLKLCTPFTYLYDIFDQIHSINEEFKSSQENTKNVRNDGLGETKCSTQVLSIWETWIRTKNHRTRICCFAVKLSPNSDNRCYHCQCVISRVFQAGNGELDSS